VAVAICQRRETMWARSRSLPSNQSDDGACAGKEAMDRRARSAWNFPPTAYFWCQANLAVDISLVALARFVALFDNEGGPFTVVGTLVYSVTFNRCLHSAKWRGVS